MARLSQEEFQYYQDNASDTLQPNLIAVAVCGLVLAYAAVLARLVARSKSQEERGKDDWLVVAALLPLTGYAICIFVMVSFGGGRHIIFVTDAGVFVSSYIAATISYALTGVLIKISILCFYRRIFSTSKALLWDSWVIALVTISYNIALVLVTALECIPISALWTGNGHCLQSQLPVRIALSIVNTLTDVIILALPIPLVWKLQMRGGRKIRIISVFLLGALVCVFSIARAVSIATSPQVNKSYTQAYPGIWSFAEISMGTVAACLPTLGGFCTERLLRLLTLNRSNLSNITGPSLGTARSDTMEYHPPEEPPIPGITITYSETVEVEEKKDRLNQFPQKNNSLDQKFSTQSP